jgi:hypothetical protein
VGVDARFGFVVERKISDGPATGEWQFVNLASGDIVHSVAITSLAITGNTATFSGVCRNERAPEGTPCSFFVIVQDNGEDSQAMSDTYIVTGTGFVGAAGAVVGNVKIHPAPASVSLAGGSVGLLGKGDRSHCEPEDGNGDGRMDLIGSRANPARFGWNHFGRRHRIPAGIS